MSIARIVDIWPKILRRLPPHVRTESGSDCSPHDRPVFVLTQHRSGGTLLSRLLNCHDGLVIWGEHAGFLDALAEADAQLERDAKMMPERSMDELRRYVSTDRLADVKFRPWMLPFSRADFRRESRAMVLSVFTRGLQPQQRWGFKEVRYHRPQLLNFLHQLFPRAHFVLLYRDPVDLCVSSLLAPWTLERLRAEGFLRDERAFLRSIDDEILDILMMRRNWTDWLASTEAQCISLQYEEIVSDMAGQMARLFQFLGLRLDLIVRARMRISMKAIAGPTPKETVVTSEDRRNLTVFAIREAVERRLPELSAKLAQDARPAMHVKHENVNRAIASLNMVKRSDGLNEPSEDLGS
jgi:Sulfotransferase family